MAQRPNVPTEASINGPMDGSRGRTPANEFCEMPREGAGELGTETNRERRGGDTNLDHDPPQPNVFQVVMAKLKFKRLNGIM